MENQNVQSNTPKRIINWWLQWEDLNWPNADGLDRMKRRVEKAAEANVTTAITFGAHFRWDYLPYFTILHDHIASLAEELHKCGIELYDRHSVNLIHRYDTVEEMRRVMLHSGPHLPFSPSREAAESWTYHGKKLNDWRMVDVRTREPLYYPQYAGEGFCYRNPEFVEAYCDYAKRLVADTGIDGLAAEDPVHYLNFRSCACPHCRAELQRRAGIDLPPISDRNFWGNWENPAWHHWIDLRFDSGREFFEKLAPVLPEGFPITTCGSDSASCYAISMATDARKFIAGGSNYVHSELCGNTPPYPHDPVTVNVPVADRAVAFSHHQAVAREHGVRSFSTGYGFTKPTANIIWAVNKILDNDCCFSTLKARLGLPDHILRELPEESDVVGEAYTFEKENQHLFMGKQFGQLGVYFSYETRNHTFFGGMSQGYNKEYSCALDALFKAGLSPHTIFDFPVGPEEYPLVILSSVAAMTDKEIAAMNRYVANGGKLLVMGPTPLPMCKNSWQLPTHPDIQNPEDYFCGIRDGVWVAPAKWVVETKLPPCQEPNQWQEVANGILYNPHRISEMDNSEIFLNYCKSISKKLPVEIVESDGYLITFFEGDQSVYIHLLAAEYDTDIDHHLDEIRFHRSRVNLITKAEPIGISETVRLRADGAVKVHIPFHDDNATVCQTDGVYDIKLPKNTAYAIIEIQN